MKIYRLKCSVIVLCLSATQQLVAMQTVHLLLSQGSQSLLMVLSDVFQLLHDTLLLQREGGGEGRRERSFYDSGHWVRVMI